MKIDKKIRTYECKYPGCGHSEESDGAEPPRHQHGKALVQMHIAPIVTGSIYLAIEPDNKKKRVARG